MSKRKPAVATAPAPAEAPAPQRGGSQRLPVQGVCAIVGTVICVFLNVSTDGKVPGGYAAGVIGGGIGWAVGVGLEKLMESPRWLAFMARYYPK